MSLSLLEPEAAPIETRGFELAGWQQEAVQAWVKGDSVSQHRGTLEIFTGGGKTLIALSCLAIAASEQPNLRAAIVVPTEALAHQWRKVLLKYTTLKADEIGQGGGRSSDSLSDKRALILILATARKVLPEMSRANQPLMLIVDECHRAGSPKNAAVLKTIAPYRLGLSATPEREEIDDAGEPLEYDDQILGKLLGEVVYRFSLKEARAAGWLPTYLIRHHGISLTADERSRYEKISKKVDDLADQLEDLGVARGSIQHFKGKPDERGRLANAWTAATLERKDLLFRAEERQRVSVLLLKDVLARRPDSRVLVFNERVNEAEALHAALTEQLPDATIGLEHSKLSPRQRNDALDQFRTGQVQVLVSVKALIEGLDVPEIDIALSVASTSSVRQRIQSLGRALRRRFDQDGPDEREVYILYIHDSADEEIYGREDWSDITGEAANQYFVWPLGEEEPREVAQPPRTPLPSEEQIWEQLGGKVPESPQLWPGAWPDSEYTVDTNGTVRTEKGVIANPQGVNDMIQKVRSTPAGRFYVTPIHRLVLVSGEGDNRGKPFLVGQLTERYQLLADTRSETEDFDVSTLRPGDDYPGPMNEEQGLYHLGKRRGGVVEKRVGRERGFAFTEGGENPQQEGNARRVLEAWRSIDMRPNKFSVNHLGHAYYLDKGVPKFLAEVSGGFRWPPMGGQGGTNGALSL